MEVLFIFALGILVGLVIAWIIKPRPVGDLKMHSDEDGTYMFLELEKDLNYIRGKTQITLNVRDGVPIYTNTTRK